MEIWRRACYILPAVCFLLYAACCMLRIVIVDTRDLEACLCGMSRLSAISVPGLAHACAGTGPHLRRDLPYRFYPRADNLVECNARFFRK